MPSKCDLRGVLVLRRGDVSADARHSFHPAPIRRGARAFGELQPPVATFGSSSFASPRLAGLRA
jgi:hypothetical protein